MKRFVILTLASLLGLEVDTHPRADDRQPPEQNAPAQTNAQAGHSSAGASNNSVGRPPSTGNRPAIVPSASRPRPVTSSNGEKPDPHRSGDRHPTIHARPKPQQIPPVQFGENRRIKGSESWAGEKYAAFRSYRAHRHDRNWYHQHCHRIILICGGYYYWYNFYWYPAWGYSPLFAYYVYDGPIYAGSASESPDQVTADVQAALQDLGYYLGEIDGILGASTRDAISAYQSDNGLYQTAAIDQPTLQALGLD